jgi:hypothetical protein
MLLLGARVHATSSLGSSSIKFEAYGTNRATGATEIFAQ